MIITTQHSPRSRIGRLETIANKHFGKGKVPHNIQKAIEAHQSNRLSPTHLSAALLKGASHAEQIVPARLAGPSKKMRSYLLKERVEGFKSKSDIHSAMSHVNARYVEMNWLTGNVNATPEGIGASADVKSVSAKIFGKAHSEYDRTAVGVDAIRWVLLNDYDQFTKCQAAPIRLSRASFDQIRQFTLDAVGSDAEALDALIVLTIVNDLGKINDIVHHIQTKLGIEEVDHEKILTHALEHFPEISPSFNRLSPYYKDLILRGLKANFSFARFNQLEAVPASLSGLEGLDQASLDLNILHSLYDLAGAAGQVTQDGSVVMIEPVYQGCKMSIAALRKLSQGASVEDVYNDLLAQKAAIYKLDISKPDERAVTRISTQMRLTNEAQAHQVLEVYRALPKNQQAILNIHLNKTGITDGFATEIQYSPAIFVNAQAAYTYEGLQTELINAGLLTLEDLTSLSVADARKKIDTAKAGLAKEVIQKIQAVALSQAAQFGLQTSARVFQQAATLLKKRTGNGVFAVDVNALAAAANTPNKLSQMEIKLERVGVDAKAVLAPHAALSLEGLPVIEKLSDLGTAKNVLLIAIGGGSDSSQADGVGHMLRAEGTNVSGIVSVRKNKGDLVLEAAGESLAPGVTKILSDTKAKNVGTSGRGFFEALAAKANDTVMVDYIDPATLKDRLAAAIQNYEGRYDAIMLVDTGGDAYQPWNKGQESSDQDQQVAKAIHDLDLSAPTYMTTVAPGIDSPANMADLLKEANAVVFNPSTSANAHRQALYDGNGMNPALPNFDQTLFGKTSLTVQRAMAGNNGLVVLDFPESFVLSNSNPWDPHGFVDPAHGKIVLAAFDKYWEVVTNK